MSAQASHQPSRIDRFFAGPGSRCDQWRDLVELAEAWCRDAGKRASVDAALADLMATEPFHAYPGHRLITALQDHIASDDPRATAALARRIARALLTRSFRQSAGDWEADEDNPAISAEALPPINGRDETHRPYFEILVVTGAPPARWPALAAEWRRLRRPLDAFVYEPVLVGSFEDAFCATMLNTDLAAVVIHEGFAFRSRQDAPVLRSLTAELDQYTDSQESALALARVIKRLRPELDLYLLSN